LQEKWLANEDARLLQLLPRRRRSVTVIEPTELEHEEFPFTRKAPIQQREIKVIGTPICKVTTNKKPIQEPIKRKKLPIKPRSLTGKKKDTDPKPINTLREALEISHRYGTNTLTENDIEHLVEKHLSKVITYIRTALEVDPEAPVTINVNGKIYE